MGFEGAAGAVQRRAQHVMPLQRMGNPGGTGPAAAKATPTSPAERAARATYRVLAWILVGCVAYQVFLAGLAVFVHPLNWGRHVGFVHWLELIPALLLILALVGRMPKGHWCYMGPVGIYLLIGCQYAFAGAGGSTLAALHTVNALLIFWAAIGLARQAGRLGRTGAEA